MDYKWKFRRLSFRINPVTLTFLLLDKNIFLYINMQVCEGPTKLPGTRNFLMNIWLKIVAYYKSMKKKHTKVINR